MKIEVGKKYTCRHRSDVKYVEIVRYQAGFTDRNYLGVVCCTDGTYLSPQWWDKDGAWLKPTIEADWDLVAEYKYNWTEIVVADGSYRKVPRAVLVSDRLNQLESSRELSCECGAKACGHLVHSSWCPLAKEVNDGKGN